ncbi:hypothetical protein DPMN_142103 [Dreissena polymorpha]|uniref:Uncharacterized protein n=1 Tax=Dreissena polymorpha TaxID=45954 RepID=A0A9D4GB08_DREPO|nr:hypothetical protein DPMN_142103 [Dreissena polymorpha]
MCILGNRGRPAPDCLLGPGSGAAGPAGNASGDKETTDWFSLSEFCDGNSIALILLTVSPNRNEYDEGRSARPTPPTADSQNVKDGDARDGDENGETSDNTYDADIWGRDVACKLPGQSVERQRVIVDITTFGVDWRLNCPSKLSLQESHNTSHCLGLRLSRFY